MIWADRKARTLAAMLLGAGLAGAAVAGPVVVRSTGPSARAYPAGRQLPDNAQLALKAGDTIVLLDSKGTRTVSGPGNFAAVGSGTRASATATASRILSNQGSSERRGGAVRGAGGDAEIPTVWLIDPTKSGTVCVAGNGAPSVWRRSTGTDGKLQVSGTAGTGEVMLARGQSTAAWPSQVPVVNGGEYTLALDAAAPAKVKIVSVPAVSSNEEMAAQFITKGCTAQLDRLITMLNRMGASG